MSDWQPEEPPIVDAPSIPHSREAEEAVIGSVLIDPAAYNEISQFLVADDFYIHRNRFVWNAFQDLHLSRTAIDLLTVADALEKSGSLAEIGGPAYLTSTINQVPTSINAVDYAHIVKEHSDRRRGIVFANKMAQGAYNLAEPFDLRSSAMKIVQTSGGRTRRVSAKQAASQAIDQIGKHSFCEFGIPNLDSRIGGIFQDEANILAGYQGSGKSALKIHAMRHNADKGKVVLDCSLEMSAAQIWMRMACADLQIDLNQVRSGKVSHDTEGHVMRKAGELAEQYDGRIVIYESPMTPADVLSATMLEQPDLLCLDHLRLLAGKPQRESLMEWYNYCIRFLRMDVAKGEHVTTLILHQINRSAFKESRRPSMHDLAFAGEDDPDGVFLLYRKENTNGDPNLAPIEIIVDKSRFGWTGIEEATFNLREQKFYGRAADAQRPSRH